MAYEKITEGNNEFCKIVETQIFLKSKPEIEKAKKNLEEDYAKVTEDFNNKITELNKQLEIFN